MSKQFRDLKMLGKILYSLKKCKKLHQLSIRLLIVIVLVSVYSFYSNLSINELSNDELFMQPTYTTEWITLNQQLYIRKTAVFYFYDEHTIELLMISETNGPKNLSFRIRLLNANVTFNRQVIYKELASSRESKLRLYTLKCELNNTFLSNENTVKHIDLNENILLYVRNDDRNEETDEPILVSLKAKHLQKSAVKTRGRFMLCSKYFTMSRNDYVDFKTWIEFNVKFGFEKIVIFNTSIVNNEDFNRLFAQYKGILEVRHYKEFPFINNNQSRFANYFRRNKEAAVPVSILRLEQIHEHVAINECYMAHRTYYDHIAQFDTDELIVPKMSFEWQREPNRTLQCGSNEPGKSDLEVYFDQLYEIDKYRHTESLWFNYADVAYNRTANDIVDGLKATINSIKNPNEPNQNLTIRLRKRRNQPLHRNITYAIKTKDEYEYGIYLVNLLTQLNTSYTLFSNITNRFHTALLLFNLTNMQYNGKSIHNTKYVRYIGQHFTYTSKYTKVNYEHGYTIHFRNRLKFLNAMRKFLSIKDVYIDYKYFECNFDSITGRYIKPNNY